MGLMPVEGVGALAEADGQGGGPAVTYKSVSGTLRIVTSEDEKISEPKIKEKPTPQSKDQMDVLRKIERGEISVDEALKELNA